DGHLLLLNGLVLRPEGHACAETPGISKMTLQVRAVWVKATSPSSTARPHLVARGKKPLGLRESAGLLRCGGKTEINRKGKQLLLNSSDRTNRRPLCEAS